MGDLLPSPGAFRGTEVSPVVLLPEGHSSGCWSPFPRNFGFLWVSVESGDPGYGPAGRREGVLRPFLVRVPLLSAPIRAEEARLVGAFGGWNADGPGAGDISKFFVGPRLTLTQSRMPLSESYLGSPTGFLAWGGSPIQTAPKLVSKLKERRMEVGSLLTGFQKEGPGAGVPWPACPLHIWSHPIRTRLHFHHARRRLLHIRSHPIRMRMLFLPARSVLHQIIIHFLLIRSHPIQIRMHILKIRRHPIHLHLLPQLAQSSRFLFLRPHQGEGVF